MGVAHHLPLHAFARLAVFLSAWAEIEQVAQALD